MKNVKKRLVYAFISCAVVMSPVVMLPSSVYASSSQIRITEIMFDPSGNGNKEFLEIYNGSDTSVNLTGMSLFGVDYTFPAGSTLASKQYGVIVRNLTVFKSTYPGVRVFGEYGGKLRGSGELVSISKNGVVQTQVSYGFGGAWPSTPKDGGPSLSLVRSTANESLAACWSASSNSGGSPGSTNSTASSGGTNCGNKAYPGSSSPQKSTASNGSPATNDNTKPTSQSSPKKETKPETNTIENNTTAQTEATIAKEASGQIASEATTTRSRNNLNNMIALGIVLSSVAGLVSLLVYKHIHRRLLAARLLGKKKPHHHGNKS